MAKMIPMRHAEALISCGHHKGREIFVARQDRDDTSLYILCAFIRCNPVIFF